MAAESQADSTGRTGENPMSSILCPHCSSRGTIPQSYCSACDGALCVECSSTFGAEHYCRPCTALAVQSRDRRRRLAQSFDRLHAVTISALKGAIRDADRGEYSDGPQY